MAPHDTIPASRNSSLSEPLLQHGSVQEECSLPDTLNDTIQGQIEESGSLSPTARSTEIPSRNVNVILLYTFTVFAGRSIWNQNVLANFAALLMDGDPKAIGFLSSAMGISQLVASFPAGYFADKYRRDTLCKVSSGIGVMAVATSVVAVYSASYVLLVVSLSVWGIYFGCAQTSIGALFADAVPHGQRSRYFTTRSVLVKIGQLTGPILALGLFFALGDQWTVSECASVMAVGQFISLPAVLLLCFLDDDLVPTQPHQHNHEEEGQLEVPLVPSSIDREHPLGENNDRAVTEDATATRADFTLSDCDEIYNKARLSAWFPFLSNERIVPTLIATADVTSGLASGMSVRFFAIFLAQNLQMGPVVVQVLYIAAPVVQVGVMKCIQLLANRFGRCQMAVAFKWVGIILMVSMVGAYICELPVWLICTILVMRTAFMNSPSALTRSVLMDHVRKEERAKWSALESLNMFSWSGSAALGGLLVDRKGILFNFCITAGLQFLSTMPLLALALNSRKVRQSSGGINGA